MSTILFNIFAFIVALGLLITFHEYGHFWVARKVGVKVLRFSIGFGKPIWSRVGKVDNTEYAVAAIPLGGYVKMLDEREGNVDPSERHRSFNTQSVWARIAIVAAGPIANFLLAIVAFWLAFIIGVNGIVPLVGDVSENSIAARAGFASEEKILSVAGEATPTWDAVRLKLIKAVLKEHSNEVEVEVETPHGDVLTRRLDTTGLDLLNGESELLSDLGLTYWWPDVEPIIGGVQPSGAADLAGLQAGDKVVSADGTQIESWQAWVMFVRERPEKTFSVIVDRRGVATQLLLTPRSKAVNDTTIGFIGAYETQTESIFNRIKTTVHYSPVEAVSMAVARTWDMTMMTLRVMAKLVVGEASLDNISGPITIAQYAGQSASIGLTHYLGFLAMISISLGVLNLLPIPMLDGGHLLYFFVEVVKGSPVSEKVQMVGQQIGMLALLALMSLAFYNDVLRLMG